MNVINYILFFVSLNQVTCTYTVLQKAPLSKETCTESIVSYSPFNGKSLLLLYNQNVSEYKQRSESECRIVVYEDENRLVVLH